MKNRAAIPNDTIGNETRPTLSIPSIQVSPDLDIDTLRYRINTRREQRFDTDYLVSGKSH